MTKRCSTQALIGMFQPLNGVLNTSKKQEAREAYANIMAVKHATFKVNPAGLRVCTRQPFLAAVVVKVCRRSNALSSIKIVNQPA